MKNRAKCLSCKSVIESFHDSDYVMCTCGAIAVDGGSALKCYADDWANFVRIDDEGNEVKPSIVEEAEVISSEEEKEPKTSKPSKRELIEMLDSLIESYENLPQGALYSSVSNADLASALLILSSILKAD